MTETEFYINWKRLVELDLSEIIDETLVAKNAKQKLLVSNYFYILSMPRPFTPNSNRNQIVEMENAFEDLCCVLEDSGAINVKGSTTFEFFKRVDFYENKFKSRID